MHNGMVIVATSSVQSTATASESMMFVSIGNVYFFHSIPFDSNCILFFLQTTFRFSTGLYYFIMIQLKEREDSRLVDMVLYLIIDPLQLLLLLLLLLL